MVRKLPIYFGILGAIAFYAVGTYQWFWTIVGCSAGAIATFWLLSKCARRGFVTRLESLRERLLYSRTVDRKVMAANGVDAIEGDEIDVLIARIQRSSLDALPSWAVCEIDEINSLGELAKSFPPGLDPDAQPLWLICINGACLLACTGLGVMALVRYFWR